MRTAALAACLLLAACTTASPHATPRPGTHRAHRAAPATARCAWYAPVGNSGQQVDVTATGPACSGEAFAGWLAAATRLTWITTAYIPGTAVCIGQMSRAGTTVRVWQDGWARATQQAAGYLADDLQQSGWTPMVPPSGPAPSLDPQAPQVQ